MKTAILLAAMLSLASLFSGCVSSLPKQLDDLDRLGITEAEITGKWSHTSFKRTEDGGKVIATIEHSNAWFPRIMMRRELPAKAPESGK